MSCVCDNGNEQCTDEAEACAKCEDGLKPFNVDGQCCDVCELGETECNNALCLSLLPEDVVCKADPESHKNKIIYYGNNKTHIKDRQIFTILFLLDY